MTIIARQRVSSARKTTIDHVSDRLSELALVSVDAEWQEKTSNTSKFSPSALDFYNNFVLPNSTAVYPLLVQMGLRLSGTDRYLFFIDSDLYNQIEAECEQWLKAKADEGIDLAIVPLATLGEENLLEIALSRWEVPNTIKVELLMFYSPKDLELTFGKEYWLMLLENDLVVQKRNIKVNISKNSGSWLKTESGYKFKFKDLKGWQGKGGLASLCNSVNVPMRAKKDLDDVKGHMVEAFMNRTNTALEYSLGDVEVLPNTYEKYQRYVSEISQDLLGVEIDYELPATTGSLVASVYEKWLNERMGVDAAKFAFANTKLALLDDTDSNYKRDRIVWNKVIKSVKNKSNWRSIQYGDSPLTKAQEYKNRKGKKVKQSKSTYEQFQNIRPQYKGYSQCSVSYFAYKASHSSEGINAIVQGGRCNNERADEQSLDYTLDIDLKSCYGSALKNFSYPVGLPTTYGFTENEERPTLEQFLKNNESELVPGQWTITVETDEPLSFRQDLIFSKTTTLHQIRTAYVEGFKDGDTSIESDMSEWWKKDEPSNIGGDFALILKEILNGIITSEILETIKAVATDKEWSELRSKLKVVSAAIYRKSDRKETLDDWCNAVIEDTGRYGSTTGKVKDIKDTRTNAWCEVKLIDFLGNLLEERGRIKQLKRSATGDEKSELSARDAMLKLFINTLYGVFASPYFSIGNTVLANNITGKARVGAWKMNKALHTRMSITDGGFYTPLVVPYLDYESKEFQKPGLDALANNHKWGSSRKSRYRGQKTQTLGGLDWVQTYQTYQTQIEAVKEDKGAVIGLLLELASKADDLAFKHIQNFWGHYGLTLNFDIEHKETNTGLSAAYSSKGHYAFDTIQGDRVYRIRGAKNYREAELRKSPYFELFDNLLDGVDKFPDELCYDHFYLLKIGEWSKAKKSEGYVHLDGLMPGDAVRLERNQKFGNMHLPFDTIQAFTSVKKRRTYRMVKGQRIDVPKFEKHADKGISGVLKAMVSDSKKVNTKFLAD